MFRKYYPIALSFALPGMFLFAVSFRPDLGRFSTLGWHHVA